MLDGLAREQAILNAENEIEMDADLAADLNAASFRKREERNLFKNAYQRHSRNIAGGNRFYL